LVQAGEAQVLEAKARVRRAELELSFTKVLSPIDGIAGAANAQIGDLVGTPQVQFLTRVSTVNPIKVYVHISEHEYMATVERSNGKTGFAEAVIDAYTDRQHHLALQRRVLIR
jgi:membrane fusion protein (multidrug efflux system)